MSLQIKKVRTVGAPVSQLRDNTEYDYVVDDETGQWWIPLHVVVADAEEKPSGKKKTTSKDKETEKEDSEEVDVKTEVTKLAKAFDVGTLPVAKVAPKLAELTGKDEKTIKKLLVAFSNAEEPAVKDLVKSLMADDDDDEDPDEDDAPKKKIPAKKSTNKKKETLVEASDLEKGQKVAVYWDTDTAEDPEVEWKQWFKGTVLSIKGDEITIKWKDGTKSVYDEELMTKIKEITDEEYDEDED